MTHDTHDMRDKQTQTPDKLHLSEAEWRDRLDPETFRVTRQAGTERPFTGKYDGEFSPGTYKCSCCGQPLFESEAKFNSGCGWPAFSEPKDQTAIEARRDDSHGMERVEVLCSRCDAHLGHVFLDGPPERGGMRFCINSASLDLERREEGESA